MLSLPASSRSTFRGIVLSSAVMLSSFAVSHAQTRHAFYEISRENFELIHNLPGTFTSSQFIIVEPDSQKALGIYEKEDDTPTGRVMSVPVSLSADGSCLFSYQPEDHDTNLPRVFRTRNTTKKGLYLCDNAQGNIDSNSLGTTEKGGLYKSDSGSENDFAIWHLEMDAYGSGLITIKWESPTLSKPSYYLSYNKDEDRFVTSESPDTRFKIYCKDVFMLDFADDFDPTLTRDHVKLKLLKSTYNKQYFYLFNDGIEVSKDKVVTTGTIIPHTTSNNETIEIPRTNATQNSTLWIVPVEYKSKGLLKTAPLYRFDLTGATVSETLGHFTHPSGPYEEENAVDFQRAAGVRILYTLDGNAPALVPSIQVATYAMTQENDAHSGMTYDLDERPIIYQGEELSITYIALKAGYKPSAPASLTLTNSPTTGISDIYGESYEKARYYNLQGHQLPAPPSNGIYILRQGSKVLKIKAGK